MFPAYIAVIAAVLAAEPGTAAPGAAPEPAPAPGAVASLPLIRDTLLQMLPPAPVTVVRKTKTYGTVTIDHRKHLALRATCSRCHGPGAVTKFELTPKIAHDRCKGCHQERGAGPTHCTGCHVKQLPLPGPVLAEAAPAEKTPALAIPVATRAAPPGAPAAGGVAPRRSRDVFELGFAGGPGIGPSFRLASRRDGVVTSYSVERLSSSASARILTLLGVGLTRPLVERLVLEGGGVVGLDAQERPDVGLSPALGARVALEWMPRRRWAFGTLHLSLTGVFDLGDRVYGQQEGRVRVFATLATGLAR
jgi:hypothetical protein